MKKRANATVLKNVQSGRVRVLNLVVNAIHHVDVVHLVKICLIILNTSLVIMKNVLPILVFQIGSLKMINRDELYQRILERGR
jgi:hypothetical protein